MELKLNQNTIVKIDKIPNNCPWCHKVIEPIYIESNFPNNYELEVILRCANFNCSKLFIGHFYESSTYQIDFDLKGTSVGNLKEKDYSNEINNTSPSFVRIANQAYFAEQNNLLDICGVGYRKALEFLIKDYLIELDPSKENVVKNKFLGSCINELVKDEKIKSVAKRAVWLGNDETHYIKKWGSKDLNDLKKLISLTVHWIEMEKLTESFEDEMPDN